MRCYIDVHILQTVPPSNLNRDDAGTPKQAVYGGAKRARVSSQAWKRATRTAFAEQVNHDQLATRTKKISALYAERLSARLGLDPETSTRLATSVLAELGIKPGKKAAETAYLLFFGRPQLERLVDLVEQDAENLAALDDKELAAAVKGLPVKETLGTGHPIDVALFGRMVADIPALNVDAATQVAHALSTHPVDVEFDYYTAVDDENPKEDTGAGMIGTVEFQSATLYRFATVGLHQLADNLADDAEATVEALRVFLNAFTTSMPTGHQNSFAHRTTPNLVAVALRTDQPVNLVSAFEKPVRASENSGILDQSMRLLATEMSEATRMWGHTPTLVAATYRTPVDASASTALTTAFGPAVPFNDLVTTVETAARDLLKSAAR
ncbi:type I-E CRISPR-associated protein Cas7/Cse4/CasC [Frankia sp. CNm7]|uniref:Type I-E CRISPR-associated protein Cas7/Cse4/CasC n=1 Tax=Frankia nepalensis TaxID=1836974 RepID=A0A937USD5_9ACTN|nr:type I-E CRISPR-associated protein Cas7/Cse4/CasC [Frankia nepalensis]MBL7498288.1 type I-E CRISPR-associated protein Cas7/Cse4/CasC [Frankia nepalensis]MBL7509120.1 type I-E CRISPR-associated protein Cas7/Cse4/CasC [Frankia nepalensis]MBL7520807.1 type I-E CRISPR-associated protein Cas7/Cse4/CasC [Frankia nepalensis]MBL7630165.1 type I-E CRISPR-associated protein Cas7/Cse4/CasC [Frankia nepalensis]